MKTFFWGFGIGALFGLLVYPFVVIGMAWLYDWATKER